MGWFPHSYVTGYIRRLALATVLVVAIGLTQGLDAAMVVALSLSVMEIDARCS
jgi:hypothetical protein